MNTIRQVHVLVQLNGRLINKSLEFIIIIIYKQKIEITIFDSNLLVLIFFLFIRKLNTDFICFRGLLTKMLCTPYERNAGWKIAITLHNGTYYLCEFDTEQQKIFKQRVTESEMEVCCWGWKFEQYLTSGRTIHMSCT